MSEIVEDFKVGSKNSSILRMVDVRLKIISTFVLLFANVAIANVFFSVFIILNLVIFTILSKVSFRHIIKDLIVPGVFALFILVIQSFWLRGGKEIEIFGLIVYEDGVNKGIRVFFTVIAGVWLLVLTSLTSKQDEFLSGFKKLGVPSVIIDTVIMMYRYVFVLKEESLRIFFAQKVRLGYSNLVNSIRSMGELWGIMLINSLVRAGRVYEAMICRGFNGKLFYESENPISLLQVFIVCVYLLMVVGVGVFIKIYI